MSERPPIKTSIPQIIDYWSRRINECELSVDWAEAGTHCWRCGCERDLQRCHIVPDSLGGKDEPANLVLLCKRCHAEGPNVTDPDIMWDWLRAYKVPFYGIFWSALGMREYRFIYHKSFTRELTDILEEAGIPPDSDEAMSETKQCIYHATQEASTHFGQPYFNAATAAGLYRMMLKELAKKYHVSFPIPSDGEDTPTPPWWKE